MVLGAADLARLYRSPAAEDISVAGVAGRGFVNVADETLLEADALTFTGTAYSVQVMANAYPQAAIGQSIRFRGTDFLIRDVRLFGDGAEKLLLCTADLE